MSTGALYSASRAHQSIPAGIEPRPLGVLLVSESGREQLALLNALMRLDFIEVSRSNLKSIRYTPRDVIDESDILMIAPSQMDKRLIKTISTLSKLKAVVVVLPDNFSHRSEPLISAGAQACITRDDIANPERFLDLLSAALSKQHFVASLSRQVRIDHQSGLPNATALNEQLTRQLHLDRRQNGRTALLCINLPSDTEEQTLVRAFQHCSRESDYIAKAAERRYSIFTTDSNFPQWLERFNHCIQEHQIEGACIGIASSIGGVPGAKTLLARAQQALQRAMDIGSGSVQYFDRVLAAQERISHRLSSTVSRALSSGEINLEYQPVLDLFGCTIGMEALMRWHHPELGRLAAAEFLPDLLDSHNLSELSSWMLNRCCSDIKAYQKSHNGSTPWFSLNLHSQQLRDERLADLIREITLYHHISPEILIVEYHSDELSEWVDMSASKLSAIRATGVGLCADHFGHLGTPFQALVEHSIVSIKLDRSLVKNVHRDKKSRSLVTAIMAAARALNIKVIAVGVESELQLDVLREEGCEAFQGYLFNPPHPIEGSSQTLRH